LKINRPGDMMAFMKNSERGFIGTTVVVFVVLIIVALGIFWYMNRVDNTPAGPVPEDAGLPTSTPAVPGGAGVPVTLPGGLIIQDAKVGTGEEAKPGMTLSMHYTGTFADGTVFDSSVARNQPLEFTLGAGEVIAGWDQGIAGMRVGGERKLTIPPELGYGSQARGPIPANSTLHFEVVLLGVK